jgi:hypothetical protein
MTPKEREARIAVLDKRLADREKMSKSPEPKWDGRYPCQSYGKRMRDYSFCDSCPEKVCVACSMLTLELVLKQKVDLITPSGNKVTIGENLR